jgi:hypothetical protein
LLWKELKYNEGGQRGFAFLIMLLLSELVGEKLETPFPNFLDEETEQTLRNEPILHPAIERVREVAKSYWKM